VDEGRAAGPRAGLGAILDRVSLLGLGATVIAVLIVAALVIASARMPGTSATAVPSGVDTPPVGVIWFGTAVDARTFELTGRTDHASMGATIAAVARLSRPVADGEASVEVALNGTVLASTPLHLVGSDAHDLVAWTFALPVAGTFEIDVAGPQGEVLARGAVSAP
jgi:hypothetical protein